MKTKVYTGFRTKIKLDFKNEKEVTFLKEFFGNMNTNEAERIAGIKMPNGDVLHEMYLVLEKAINRGN